MSIFATDLSLASPIEVGRYKLTQPFLNYPTPDALATLTTRSFKVLQGRHQSSLANRTSYKNVILQSDSMGTTPWTTGTGAVITQTTAAVLDPEGNNNASLIAETAVSGTFDALGSATGGTSGANVFGCFLKSGGRQYSMLGVTDGTNTARAFFDLTNGIVTGTAVVSSGVANGATMVPCPNGWYWCSLFASLPGAPTAVDIAPIQTINTYSAYTGTAGIGIYAIRATVCASSAPIPPISTTTTSRVISTPDADCVVNAGSQGIDPLSVQCTESDPMSGATLGTLNFTKGYSRVPQEKISPATFVFTPPNYPVLIQSYTGNAAANFVPQSGAGRTVGNYAIISSLWVGTSSNTPNFANINGYYDVMYTGGGYQSGLGSAEIWKFETVPGSGIGVGYQVGDMILVANPAGSGYNDRSFSFVLINGIVDATHFSTVGIQSGSLTSLYGTTSDATNSDEPGGALATILTVVGSYRRQIQSGCDIGQPIGLPARIVEDYYLPGVTPGISSVLDIPAQVPYSEISYFQSLAIRGGHWFTVAVNALQSWKGAILVQKYTQIYLDT